MEPLRDPNEPTSSLLYDNTSYDPKSDARREKRSRAGFKAQGSHLGAVAKAAHLGLRIVSILFSLTIIGLLVYTMIVYHRTQKEDITSVYGYRLRAWPTKLKLYPTYSLLAAAGTAVLLNIVALLALIFAPSRFRDKAGPWTSILLSTLALTFWVVAVAYFKAWDTRDTQKWDLWSWSCKHWDIGRQGPPFRALCEETSYTWYAAIGAAAIEGVIVCWSVCDVVANRRKGASYNKLIALKLGTIQ